MPRVTEVEPAEREEIDLNFPDEELMRISQEGVLALNLEEMRIIRDYLKDDAVLTERKKVGLGSVK